MKKLLFIGIVVLMVQSLGAVTLPSESYSRYAGGSASTGTEQTLLSGGTMVTGTYSVLGAADTWCSTYTPQTDECEGCCISTFSSCIAACAEDPTCESKCEQSNLDCQRYCDGGSLPLDGGLSILLILSLAGGAVKLLRNRKS